MGYIGFQNSDGNWINPTQKEKEKFLESLSEDEKKNTKFLNETTVLKKSD